MRITECCAQCCVVVPRCSLWSKRIVLSCYGAARADRCHSTQCVPGCSETHQACCSVCSLSPTPSLSQGQRPLQPALPKAWRPAWGFCLCPCLLLLFILFVNHPDRHGSHPYSWGPSLPGLPFGSRALVLVPAFVPGTNNR